MTLFQTSVLKTYLAQQDSFTIERAYKKYTKYFHNETIQENIKNLKEEHGFTSMQKATRCNRAGAVDKYKPTQKLMAETLAVIIRNKLNLF